MRQESVLHLAEVVNLDEIFWDGGVGHGQAVLVRRRVLAGGGTSMDHSWTGRLWNLLLISGHGVVLNLDKELGRGIRE